ncbi:MAG: Na+/H+ antiporter NhaA [Desulfobacterales bacterium]|jgi:NhaA family Na+:H+ antiporter
MSRTFADTSSTPGIQPATAIIGPFQRFFSKIVTGSYPLFITATAALIWANVSANSYHSFWHMEVALSLGPFHISKSLVHWIDEAFMTLFFFTVGLEIKREVLVGGLSSPQKAILPIAAAVGGMLFPAMIYMAFNYGTPAAKGWGIPMATDIAFSLAVLAVLRDRVPAGLRLFLSAFAIADDLGAVLVIAIFYTQALVWKYLIYSLLFLAGLAVANRLWIRKTLVYVILGIGMWLTILQSGVHATVAGVVVAMFIPARGKYDTDTFVRNVKTYLKEIECDSDGGLSILMNRRHLNAVQAIDLACIDVETPLQRLEHALQSWVAYMVLPLFALANSGLVFKGMDVTQSFGNPVTLGVLFGLVAGKPLGIFLFAYLACRFIDARLPQGVRWSHIFGTALLGGIGFTMSLFISGLSFASAQFLEFSKLGIILASVISAILGLVILGFSSIEAE